MRKGKDTLIGFLAGVMLLFGTSAFADTLCRIYPTDAGKVVGPLLITRPAGTAAASWQIEIVSGNGAVGSYQLQKATGDTFVSQGSAVSSAVITTYTPDAQKFQIIMVTAPDSGTVVKVCIFN